MPGLASRATIRLGVALATLLVEYLVLAIAFDGTSLVGASGWWSSLGYSGELVRGAAVVATAGLILSGSAVARWLSLASAQLERVDFRWGAVHLLTYGAFAALSMRVFSRNPPAGLAAGLLLTAWLATGGLLLLSLARCLLSGALRSFLKVGYPVIGLGALYGGLAWYLAQRSLSLWSWLANQTLMFSAALLRPFSDQVFVAPEQALLGLGSFSVVVAAPCSGIEGMTLIALFVSGYLFRFRAALRFPNALLMIPCGIGLAWLANGLRIAALVVVGAYVSPEIAFGGFHSKAGWLLFCVLAVGLVLISQRSPFFSRTPPPRTEAMENPVAAFCVPLLALLGIGMLTSAFARSLDWFYALRVLGAAAALIAYRRYYQSLERAVSMEAVLIGAAVFCVWLLLAPSVGALPSANSHSPLATADAAEQTVWLVFRVLGSVVVVPIAEELAFRGYLQRRLLAEDFTIVPFQRFGWLSLTATSLAFGSLHPSWIAGTLAGAAYSAAAYRRGRLSDAVVAHASSNALLCIWVLCFDRWDLW